MLIKKSAGCDKTIAVWASTLFCVLPGTAARAQSVSTVTQLDFGGLLVAGPGDVTLTTTSDTRTLTGSVLLLDGAPGSRGSVDISGTPGAQVQITFPMSLLMSSAGPAATLTPIIEGGPVQVIPPSGILSLHLGGTLVFTGASSGGALGANIPVDVVYFP